jgi:urate oxidase
MTAGGPLLGARSYGKQQVRVQVRVLRLGGSDAAGRVVDVTISVTVRGGIDESYEHGDNSRLVTSDGLKALSLEVVGATAATEPEALALLVATATRARYPQFPVVEVTVSRSPWRREGATFVAEPAARPTGRAVAGEGETSVTSGLEDLTLLIASGSRFVGFVDDAYTTNRPAEDRPLAGTLRAEWVCDPATGQDWAAVRATVTSSLVSGFGSGRSESVQHLLTLMARRLLEAAPGIGQVSLGIETAALSPTGPASGASPTYAVASGPVAVTEVTLRRGQPSGG